ncbi:MAG: hypothetical protein MRJ66_14690 [Nitrospira sp.]|nr:hypothetical protein [Nitrospira sp.]
MKTSHKVGQRGGRKKSPRDGGMGRITPNGKKMESIRPWIHPEERISVDFEDAVNLNAEVVDCTTQVVTLRLEGGAIGMPHHYQNVDIPLRHVTVTEDPTRYTRNPDAPLRYGRLKLIVKSKRPAAV